MNIINYKKFYFKNFINKLCKFKLIRLVIFFILVLFVSSSCVEETFESQDSLEEFTTYLDERVTKLMKDYDIPGVNIALIQKGNITWSKAYGYADFEQGRKMTIDTVCRTQSISKSVTAWGVMKLVEQGKIGLDDPVKQYIKNWNFPDTEFSEENITVRQLLSHSAGMPLGSIGVHYSPEGDVPSLEENLFKQAHLIKEPGSSFLYSNVGFNLLELLIEEVTGQKFAEYMKKEVLIPLGMHNSSFNWSENLNPAVPIGYDLKGERVPVYVYPEKASGGLFATVEDVARFVIAGMINSGHTNNNVLKPENIKKLYTPMVETSGFYSFVSESYGLGYFIENLSNGRQAVFHGGQGHGWMTHFHSIPQKGDGIVILTNSQRSWPFISYILKDWAKWSGFSSIGMDVITQGIKIIWTLIGLVLFISLWQVWRLGQGVISGRRQFAPFSNESRFLRLVQISLFIILVLGLLWCLNQDYLFISAVFPLVYRWVGLSIFIFAVVLLLLALFPRTKGKAEQKSI